MKAIRKQMDFADGIAAHIEWITRGNDINSPTHHSYNTEEATRIAEEFFTDSNEQIEVAEKLNQVFDTILNLIRKVK